MFKMERLGRIGRRDVARERCSKTVQAVFWFIDRVIAHLVSI
jgi:hypothetical protein